ncbi:MAG: hypothetical protein DI629_10100 [Mesorhizobium amorphae]|nr:MAG: hypothetical protein DI629_10100 [Mesorhizobium amorphae]
MTVDLEEPTRLINEIGNRLVQDPAYSERDWEAIALVVGIGGGGMRMHGYIYLNDGRVEPELPEANDIMDLFARLDAAMTKVGPTTRPWKVALVQIRRSTGRVRFQFEHDDEDRWNVTPSNYRTMPEELRPPP